MGHGEGVLAIAASGHGADPTAGGEGVDPVDQSSRKQEDPKLLVVGPLQSLEEGLSEVRRDLALDSRHPVNMCFTHLQDIMINRPALL